MRTLKHLFEIGEELGCIWGNQVTGDVLDLFCEKIEAGDIGWVESRCEDAIANHFKDRPAIDGPWRNLFIFGFAAGAYQIKPNLEKQIKELEMETHKLLEQMKQYRHGD